MSVTVPRLVRLPSVSATDTTARTTADRSSEAEAELSIRLLAEAEAELSIPLMALMAETAWDGAEKLSMSPANLDIIRLIK